jgi:hypothetical protein
MARTSRKRMAEQEISLPHKVSESQLADGPVGCWRHAAEHDRGGGGSAATRSGRNSATQIGNTVEFLQGRLRQREWRTLCFGAYSDAYAPPDGDGQVHCRYRAAGMTASRCEENRQNQLLGRRWAFRVLCRSDLLSGSMFSFIVRSEFSVPCAVYASAPPCQVNASTDPKCASGDLHDPVENARRMAGSRW